MSRLLCVLCVLCVLCALAFSGCTIGDSPTLQTADMQPPPPVTPSYPKAPIMPVLQPTSEELAGLCADVPRPQPVSLPPVSTKPTRKGKPVPVVAPTQVITAAQKAASVEPTAQGYWGGSGEQTYVWHAGEIYKVYLSPNVTTGVFLPPGERQISGLRLNGDVFDVEVGRSGKDANAYDSFSITPKEATGEYKTHVVTESGRRYLLHFIIVKDEKVGMAAVSFELQRTVR